MADSWKFDTQAHLIVRGTNRGDIQDVFLSRPRPLPILDLNGDREEILVGKLVSTENHPAVQFAVKEALSWQLELTDAGRSVGLKVLGPDTWNGTIRMLKFLALRAGVNEVQLDG